MGSCVELQVTDEQNSESEKRGATIRLRMDVDYAYPSRLKSFLYTAMARKTKSGYLKNSKTIAQMVNESPKAVKAYWFFTPYTIPDKEMLTLMQGERHEAALHVATDPYKELEQLEKVTNQKIMYYTIHGTERLLARLIWRRKISQSRVPIPENFPLKNFWDFPTLRLDLVCYSEPTEVALKIAEQNVAQGKVLHIHPEWLFQRGTVNHRGPYYDVLKAILGVDSELKTISISKKAFIKIAKDNMEHLRDFFPTPGFLRKLADRGVDVFTFIDRKWSSTGTPESAEWVKADDNIALLAVKTYDEWLNLIGKKTRNMIRKSEKSGVITTVAKPGEKIVEGIWRIYNEVPIRQERAFPYYGISKESVRQMVFLQRNSHFIGAFLNGELVGFILLAYGDSTAVIEQILSYQKHSDKAVNNALIAKSVQVCSSKNIKWLMYGRIGNHPSLDRFKENNGFAKFTFPRYYVALTSKGRVTLKVGFHRELKDSLPSTIKLPLIPIFAWASRNKQRLNLWLRSRN